MTKVSVIVPVYNTEKFLRASLDSILSQTLEDIEIIIINDASTDNSPKIIAEYAKKYPDKIRVIHQAKNAGVAAARNLGLNHATGKYVSFIDSDDYIQNDMLEKMYNACEKTSSPIARVNRKLVYNGKDVSFLSRCSSYEEEQIIIPKESEYLYKETPACTNKLFLREFIKKDRFPQHLKWEDYPYTIPILAKASSVAIVPDTSYFYNINTGGTTVSDFTSFNPRILDIFECANIIGEACLTKQTPETIKKQIEFIQIQNSLQRLRDILYSNINIKDKKELMSLVSALINKKYGDYHSNKYYQESLKRILYRFRMLLIDLMVEPLDLTNETEETLKNKIKEKINDITKKAK